MRGAGYSCERTQLTACHSFKNPEEVRMGRIESPSALRERSVPKSWPQIGGSGIRPRKTKDGVYLKQLPDNALADQLCGPRHTWVVAVGGCEGMFDAGLFHDPNHTLGFARIRRQRLIAQDVAAQACSKLDDLGPQACWRGQPDDIGLEGRQALAPVSGCIGDAESVCHRTDHLLVARTDAHHLDAAVLQRDGMSLAGPAGPDDDSSKFALCHDDPS
jgi:hypothetical protein